MCSAQITQDFKMEANQLQLGLFQKTNLMFILVNWYFDNEEMSIIMQTTVTEVLWPLKSLNWK